MPLSWNEIKSRALAFSKEWEHETSEDAEAKSFWDAFFNVFGITRRRVASFETPVKKTDGKGGFVDLLWKGLLLVEHKSLGKDLDRAARQAFDYFPGIKERDLPRYVIVSDFARLRLFDLEQNEQHEFPLSELYKNVRLFGFIAGYETRSFGQEDPVNIKAAESLGKLHDQLKATGYEGHQLEVLLVRMLFCLFADDTAIFERGQFQDYIERRTSEDGSDLGMHLAQLFQVLNSSNEKRQKNLDEQLASFPYVNGRLFEEMLPLASFDSRMRETLLDCCGLDWGRISPAIFGSLFQSIMDAKARRNIGAHYTTETNILKALRPLFLDALRAEFERIKRNPRLLAEFHDKLTHIRILDPACGCGNFLVIAYRELRQLELDVLRELNKARESRFLNVGELVQVEVDQFYGIELEEFPAQIAQVAMWLMDHQMNLIASEEFGQYYVRLPLKKSARIENTNALRIDWRTIVKPEELSYIVGNPPFVGAMVMNDGQREDIRHVLFDIKTAGVLDYVVCWYRQAVEYMSDNKSIISAFVSTNSITQGEQVGIFWPTIINRGIEILFAHRTFQWSSEARGKAAVHCVIIGFGFNNVTVKHVFDYETLKAEPHILTVQHINPYLVDAPDIFLYNRPNPLCNVPPMRFGSMPRDGGHFVLSDNERDEIIAQYPEASDLIRPYIGSYEYINNISRWCLWLENIKPELLRSIPPIIERVEMVKKFRLSSKAAATRKFAETPTVFCQRAQPNTGYLMLPRVSSERRTYIPMGFMPPEVISSDLCFIVANATPYHFGVLSSTMHMAWVRAVCGRLKSDYRYSKDIVYNNFPWPEPTDKQREAIETAAQGVLDARLKFPASTLADLYDPVTMPPELTKAHQELDRAVDRAYGKTTFNTEAERVAFLFSLYQKLTSLLPEEKPKRGKRKK